MVDVQFWPLLTGVVNVDELALEKMLLNTGTLIHEARVSGRIGALTLASHGVDLCRSDMRIDRALLDGALLDIELSDTVPPDTTRQPWFGCACCPSNLCRFIPSVPGYLYGVKDNNISFIFASFGTVMKPNPRDCSIVII